MQGLMKASVRSGSVLADVQLVCRSLFLRDGGFEGQCEWLGKLGDLELESSRLISGSE